MHSQYDLELIKTISKDMSLTKLAYMVDGGKEIAVDSYCSETDLYEGHYSLISFFDDELESTVSGSFSFEDVSFVPHGKVFEDYLSELEKGKVFQDFDGDFKTLVACFVSKYNLDTSSIPKTAIALIEPYSLTGCFYIEESEHPYMAIVGDKLISFDGLNSALKCAFDEARTENDYTSEKSRKELESFKQYLESDEFENKLNQMKDDILKESAELKNYYNGGGFEQDATTLKGLMESKGISIVSSDDYIIGCVEKILDEDVFTKLVNSAFTFGEIFDEKDSDFPTSKVTIENLEFTKIVGQGVIYTIELVG